MEKRFEANVQGYSNSIPPWEEDIFDHDTSGEW
jgi:hypothetical protein